MRLTTTLIILLAVSTICTAQTTWYVPDDFSTIQGAVSDASVVNGDTVIVRPGTYVENLDFSSKSITLKSESGQHITVIDGNQSGSVVTFQNGEGADSVLDGFTLTNGYSSGGGIHCREESSPTIMNTIITGNTAGDGGGGGIACSKSSPTITNTTITGNSAFWGGGIICDNFSSPTITNTTIIGNTASYGGGIYCSFDSSPTVTNTLLWDNTASTGPEIRVGPQSTLTISYSDVKESQAAVAVSFSGTLNWGQGMIDADPIFVDDFFGDFHLTFNSPCRESGDNSTVTEPYDFEGDPRIAYGTVDIGADEFHPHLYYTGDATPSGTIQAKFVGLPGTLINGVILGVNIFDPPLPCDYGLWYMDNPMQIITGLGTIPATGVSVIPGTIPTSPAGPYTIYLQAAIDSWLTNLCPVNVQ